MIRRAEAQTMRNRTQFYYAAAKHGNVFPTSLTAISSRIIFRNKLEVTFLDKV